MGVVLRQSRAATRLATVRLPRSVGFTCLPSWNFYSTVLAAGRRRVVSTGAHPGGSPKGQQKQFWKKCFSKASVWRDDVLSKTSSPHQAEVQHNTRREMLRWLNNRYRPARGLLAPSSSVVHPQSGLQELPAETVGSFCQDGQLDRVLDVLLHQNHGQEGVVPSVDMYISLLKECAKRKALVQAKRVHAHLAQFGLESSKLLGKNVVGALVKCGGLQDALEVFHRLPQRTVSSWTAVISGYIMYGQPQEALRMYGWMQEEGVEPNSYTIVNLLKACGSTGNLEEGKRIHGEAINYRCARDIFVCTCLVDMYAKCGSIADAQNVFDGMSEHDVVSWTAMLAAYVLHGQPQKALQLYEQMQEEGVSPNGRTLVVVLQACGLLAAEGDDVVVGGVCANLVPLGKCRAIHAHARRKGYDLDVFVGSTLISMYGKFGYFQNAQHVFEGLPQQDVVLWNSILTVYVQQDQALKVLQLYEQMQEEGVSADDWTFVSALQACGMLADKEDESVVDEQSGKFCSLKSGKEMHAAARRRNYDTDVFVGSTLISLYGKCGSIVDAQNVFSGLSQQNVVSCNTMLVAYAEHGQREQVFQLYRQMQEKGTVLDDSTLLCVLQVCSKTGTLDICRQVHCVFVTGKSLVPQVANTLIHAYGKCSSMVDAQNLFDSLPQPDVVSWNALIAGYAQQGNAVAGLQCFKDMGLQGTQPDGITFLSLLSICSHAGLVDRGVAFFEAMSRDYDITPQIEHYGCMVDLLGRAGHFGRVQELLLEIPVQPDLALWLCLLGACQKHGEVVMAKQAFECAVRLQPKAAAAYLLMANIYADAGLWNCAKEVRKLRQSKDASKLPGRSWMEYEQEIQTFSVADRSHPNEVQVYALLNTVSSWTLPEKS